LLISTTDDTLETLNVGDIQYLTIAGKEGELHPFKLNFIGPTPGWINLDYLHPMDGRTLTLTSSVVNVKFLGSVEELTIGPGCKNLIVSDMPDLKRIVIQDTSTLENVKFVDLKKLEFHTPLPNTVMWSGNFFATAAGSADERLVAAVWGRNLEGVRTALAEGADPNARENDSYNNPVILLASGTDDNLEIVRALLEAGADPLQTNAGDSTALTFAEEQGATAIVDVLEAAMPARVLPAYTEKPVLPPVVLAKVEVPYTNQQVFDFEEADEVPILSILSKMGNIVFKAKDSYFTLPAERLYDAMDDESQVRYKCNSKLDGAPYTHQVDMANPYYYIQGNGNFIVSLAALNSGLHEYKVLELVESTETLDYVASANIVQTTPGANRFGNQVNIVSADHCQAGTKQKVFELHGVILTHEAPAPVAAVGDKRKRSESDSDVSRAASIIRTMSTGGKRTVSKKRRTYKKKRNYKGPYINPTYNTLPFKR
jgi:hypothetical protein